MNDLPLEYFCRGMIAPNKEEHLNRRIKRNHIENGFENGIKQLESEEYHPICEKAVE